MSAAPHAGSDGPAPAVALEQLTRRFGALTAVDHVDLAIAPGTVFGLVGRNGAGKSTVLKMLTTLLPPSEGSARVAGFDVVRRPREVRRRIGYVPQLLSADGGLTGFENLMVFARLHDVPRAQRRDRIRESLATMGLEDAADVPGKQYSGGMIRRLEIAQALLHHPTVLFLDEPTVGLDPVARRAVWEDVRRLRETSGATVLLTTHYLEEADELCDALAILDLGRAIAVGSPADLKARAGDGATLEDAFVHFTGDSIEAGGAYREAGRTRRTARRLG